MPILRKVVGRWWCVAACLGPAMAMADDSAALGLSSAPESSAQAGDRALRLFVEGAVGHITRRHGLDNEDARRVSLDLNWQARLAPAWKFVFSNRLDDVHPVDAGSRTTLNSLREAYFGWQNESNRAVVDLGRINLRNGPGYGYNPTDFFKEGAIRAATSEDPIAQRENRLGTVMLRAQRLWPEGALSVALAPKLEDAPSNEPMNPDLGATNHSDRALVVLSGQLSAGLNGQVLAFAERGKGLQLGASATALLSDAAVGFFEWTGGRDVELLPEATVSAPPVVSRHRIATGLTYTTPSRLALTVELEYNGFAARRSTLQSAAAAGGEEVIGAYLVNAQRRQEIASRKAYMVYGTQRDVGMKNLDLTGMVRVNGDDHSRFVWLEARYHLPKVDLALQWQQNSGQPDTEYGIVAARRIVQLLAAFYF